MTFLVIAAIFVIVAGSADAGVAMVKFSHNGETHWIEEEINDTMTFKEVGQLWSSIAEKQAKIVYATSPPVENLYSSQRVRDMHIDEWSKDEL
ncbi:hypothetical protein Ddc_21538 [Ditylenchus destructor]|nr:hypothetical protein Ddc_21538 [Ditylenchus destructor]